MKNDEKKITQELFPNYSSFERAISYPYFAPNYPFSFYKGEFLKGIVLTLQIEYP